MVDGCLGVVAERIYPAALVAHACLLVPHLVEVLIVGFADCHDGVAVVDGVDREVVPDAWEHIGLGTHRAADDAAVALHDAVGDGLYRVGVEMLLQQPCVGACCG